MNKIKHIPNIIQNKKMKINTTQKGGISFGKAIQHNDT